MLRRRLAPSFLACTRGTAATVAPFLQRSFLRDSPPPPQGQNTGASETPSSSPPSSWLGLPRPSRFYNYTFRPPYAPATPIYYFSARPLFFSPFFGLGTLLLFGILLSTMLPGFLFLPFLFLPFLGPLGLLVLPLLLLLFLPLTMYSPYHRHHFQPYYYTYYGGYPTYYVPWSVEDVREPALEAPRLALSSGSSESPSSDSDATTRGTKVPVQ